MSKILSIYVAQLKNSLTDLDTFMEYDQMRCILQHNFPCSPHTPSVDVAVFGFHWSKKSSTVDMTPSYELFSQWNFQSILVFQFSKQYLFHRLCCLLKYHIKQLEKNYCYNIKYILMKAKIFPNDTFYSIHRFSRNMYLSEFMQVLMKDSGSHLFNRISSSDNNNIV